MPTNTTAPVSTVPREEIPSNIMGTKLIRLPAVTARVGVQRTAVYGLIKEGRFPRPVKVGTASVWVDDEITQWIEDRKGERVPAAKRPR